MFDKIQTELMPNSPELRNEIQQIRSGTADSIILFKNGSYIKVVTAGDTARRSIRKQRDASSSAR